VKEKAIYTDKILVCITKRCSEMAHETHVTCESGLVLAAQYDEFGEVYACVVEGYGEDSIVLCRECDWEGCPMRGGRRDE